MASFGETLRRERELRGVSLREISDASKISIRFLTALEQDRLDVLPGGVFRRAFVRQYARHLGLDAERLVAEFVYTHGDAAQERSSERRREGVHPGSVLVVGAFALLAVLSVLKTGQRATKANASPAPPPAAVPVAVPAAAPPAILATTEAADDLVLTLRAHQACWVEARVDGQDVLNKVLSEGESLTLEARREIVLSVGNAGGLSFRVNDLPGVSLGRSGEVRRNIVITKQSLPSFVEESSERRRASHSS